MIEPLIPRNTPRSKGGRSWVSVRATLADILFVLLDPMMPSRVAGAFPEGVELRRVGLAEAVRVTREFLAPPG